MYTHTLTICGHNAAFASTWQSAFILRRFQRTGLTRAATGARPGPRGNLGKWGIPWKIIFPGWVWGIWAHPKGLPRPWNPFPLVGATGPLVGGPFFHKTTSPRPPSWPIWAQAILADLGPGHLGPSGPGPSWPIWARAILGHLGPDHLGPIWARTIWVPFWPGPFGSRTIWAPFGPGPFGSHLGPGPSGPIGAHGVQWFFFLKHRYGSPWPPAYSLVWGP